MQHCPQCYGKLTGCICNIQKNYNTAITDTREVPSFETDLKRQIIVGKIEALQHELQELDRKYKFKIVLNI